MVQRIYCLIHFSSFGQVPIIFQNTSVHICGLFFCFRVAEDVFDFGECSAEEEPDLFPTHQWWEDTSGRNPHSQGDPL